jgi:serine protease AprX
MFTANYPQFRYGDPALLSTPERVQAVEQYAGRGVVIAFIDSGFYSHPELAGRILLHVDASTEAVIEQAGDQLEPHDLSWHGQMTSVIAAGDGRMSGGKYRGIASEAELVLIRVSTPKGLIKERDILRGLNWLLSAHERFNIRLVNISVGGDYTSRDARHPLHRAVRRLAQAGVTVVCAAGNRGAGSVVPPASAAEAITVGGLDDQNVLDDRLWRLYHSSYGTDYRGNPKPDLIAPAMWVAGPIMPETTVAREARWLGPLLQVRDQKQAVGVLKKGYADLGIARKQAMKPDDHLYSMIQARINTHKIVDAHHQHVDGTSVAAPIVTAVIAQMLEANPGLTPRRIRAILRATARPLADAAPERQGAGVLCAAEAVQRAARYRG